MLQQQMTVELPLLHEQHKNYYHGFAEGNYFTLIFNVLKCYFKCLFNVLSMLLYLNMIY